MTSIDHRKAAEHHLDTLIAEIKTQPQNDARESFLRECDALLEAIRAFHMEGIRFRMFNVDRLISRGALPLSESARRAFADVRTDLEAAGFHTRSHQAPS